MIQLVAVVGPTASGKSALGLQLAKRCRGEIISADSMQIYQKMQIGTAKPTKEEMGEIPHHLVDFLDPSQDFSVAEYVDKAKITIQQIVQREKLPILVGGTGLYIRTLLENIQFEKIESDKTVRDELTRQAEQYGPMFLWEKLKKVDKPLAEKLHPNNIGRVIRALEVYEVTGVPMSRHQELSRTAPKEYDACMIGLTFRDRQKLYDRINNRVDCMMEQGLLKEAEDLYHDTLSRTARQAIGYKELFAYFEGQISLKEAVEKLKQESRRYAKRQLTWFRRDQEIHWIYVDEIENFEKMIDECEKYMVKCGILCYNKRQNGAQTAL